MKVSDSQIGTSLYLWYYITRTEYLEAHVKFLYAPQRDLRQKRS